MLINKNLFADLESQASQVKYDFQISEMFGKILEDHKVELTTDQQEQLKWEILLFRLMAKNSFANDGVRTERFAPMATFADGRIFPDPNSFSEEAFSYFETRAKETTNPILKARYLDFMWEKSKQKKKHLFAIEAVGEYMATIDAYDNEDFILEKLDALQRATELCLVLEGKKEKKPLTEKVVSKLNQLIEGLIQQKNYRWLLELFELVIGLSQFYSDEQVGKFITLCEQGAKYYYEDQNFHLQRAFLGMKANLGKLLDSPSTIKHDVDEAIGQSLLDEAEAKSGSGLVKTHFLQEAIQHYTKMGNQEKVEELIAEVKTATAQAIEGGEFKQISTDIELTKDDWENMKSSLGENEVVPQNIGTLQTFFPNWESAVQLTKEDSNKFVFMHLAKKVAYNGKYPIGTPLTPEQEQEDQIMFNYKFQVELSLHWLTGCLTELIKEKKVSIDDFKKFFENLNSFDVGTYESVMDGLTSFFDSDHYRAVCTLAPQLEDFLRLLLGNLGGQTTKVNGNGFEEKTLSAVLLELKPVISERVYYYINWVMRDYRGFNLRNNVAHGFFKKKHGNPVYSIALIHIFCLLIANTKVSAKK